MQINYEEEARRKQEERQQQMYQAQRDPFKYGQEVARRRYSEIMSGLQNQKQDVSRSYSDMYQAAKQQAVAQRAAGAPSLSGGMKAQYSDLVSAREMQQLGQIGSAREQAMRELELRGQSAFANAELEGMQATQLQLQNQQTQLGMIQQKNQILSDKNLTNQQKAEQLRVLGYNTEADEIIKNPDINKGTGFGWTAVIGGGIGATTAIAKGIKALSSLKGVAAVAGGPRVPLAGFAKFKVIAGLGFKFVAAAAFLAAVVYGVEKLIDPEGKNQTGVEDAIDKLLGVNYG